MTTHYLSPARQALLDVLGSIEYKPGFRLRTGRERGRSFLQVKAWVADADGPHDDDLERQFRGGKVWLSDHMVDGEIVQAAFGAFRAFEEHECREWFRYRGARVFGPHIDPDAPAEVCHRTVGRS